MELVYIKDFLQGRSVFDLNEEERKFVHDYLAIMLEGFDLWELTQLEFKSLVELIVVDIAIDVFKLPKDRFKPPENWREELISLIEYIREKYKTNTWGETLDYLLLHRNSIWTMMHYGRRAEIEKEGLARAIIDFLYEGKVAQPTMMIFL